MTIMEYNIYNAFECCCIIRIFTNPCLCKRWRDRGFESRSGQTKDYKISICCFFAKHAALRRKSKDWLALDRDNVSEWGEMSLRRLLFQCASTIKIQLSLLV